MRNVIMAEESITIFAGDRSRLSQRVQMTERVQPGFHERERERIFRRAWLVAGSGIAVAALLTLAASREPAALNPGVIPLVAPALPLWPAAAVLIGLLPALVSPAPRNPAPRGAAARKEPS